MSWRLELGDGYWYDNKPDYYGLTEKEIAKVEKLRNCRFVCEWVMRTEEDFSRQANLGMLFWNDEPHPAGSNWMMLFRHDGQWLVRDGIEASRIPICCVVSNDKQLLFSKSNYDFRTSHDGSVSVDGGRNYMRILGNIKCERKWLAPQLGELTMVPETMAKLMQPA